MSGRVGTDVEQSLGAYRRCMRIAVLGPLEVLTEGSVPVVVPGAKERLLLAVLTAAAPGVVSAECISESLWDGAPPASARKSLQAHLVRLRSALEPDRPKGSTGRYVVRPRPAAVWVPGHWDRHPRGWVWVHGCWR